LYLRTTKHIKVMKQQRDIFNDTDIEVLISVLELMKKKQATIYQFDKLVKSLITQNLYELKLEITNK